MDRIKFDSYEKGDSIPELKSGPIGHMDLVRYAGASGDFNPIHTDPDFAKKVGLGGTIAHGMYVMAQLGRLCSNWAPQDQIQSFGVKFKGMTKPGQILSLTGKIKRKKEDDKSIAVSVQAAIDDGTVVVTGDLVVIAD